MNTAVMLLLFNRPDLTRRVFESIRQARPKRLYLAADGPREGIDEDESACEQARAVVSEVDWPCEVYRLYRSRNLGCRHAVHGALDWFFDQEEKGIVMEDDCLADPSWFEFAEQMLNRYSDNKEIICVSASHMHGDLHQPDSSYFFSIFNHCWGWATWRDGWQKYDDAMADWPRLKKSNWLRKLGGGSLAFKRYWTEIFDRLYQGRIDSWAYYWTYSAWLNNSLTVLPSRNLVVNLGFDEKATHTAGMWHLGGQGLQQMEFPLTHPEAVERDEWADRWTARNHFHIAPYGEMLDWLMSQPMGHQLVHTVKRILRKGPSDPEPGNNA